MRQLGVTTVKSSPAFIMVVHLVSPDGRYDDTYLRNYGLLYVKDRLARIEARTRRFDAWESCLSWLPVTEAGDVAHHHGFLLDRPQRHGAALHIDTSEWDDPDF